jgi:hypothetical protein
LQYKEYLVSAKQINYSVTPKLAHALKCIGRAEDVRFSPDYSRLALVGFSANRLLIINCKVTGLPEEQVVRLDDYFAVESPAFSAPHGIDWQDADTLLISNRTGGVAVFRLPESVASGCTIELQPITWVQGDDPELVSSPGSIVVNRLSQDMHQVLVCNNYVH